MASAEIVIRTLESIVATLHREIHTELGCPAQASDAFDDHHQEVALAGQIVMDLRARGIEPRARRK